MENIQHKFKRNICLKNLIIVITLGMYWRCPQEYTMIFLKPCEKCSLFLFCLSVFLSVSLCLCVQVYVFQSVSMYTHMHIYTYADTHTFVIYLHSTCACENLPYFFMCIVNHVTYYVLIICISAFWTWN